MHGVWLCLFLAPLSCFHCYLAGQTRNRQASTYGSSSPKFARSFDHRGTASWMVYSCPILTGQSRYLLSERPSHCLSLLVCHGGSRLLSLLVFLFASLSHHLPWSRSANGTSVSTPFRSAMRGSSSGCHRSLVQSWVDATRQDNGKSRCGPR